MEVILDYEEKRTGRYPLVFKKYKNLQQVYDYLFQNFQGYHFCILMDVTKDEYEEYPKDLYVYFSDDAIQEIATYSGYKIKKEN